MADINQPSLPFESPFVFVRHPRARRYVIRVEGDGSVRVTVPRWGSKRDAAAFAEQQRSWIETQQRRAEEERQRPRPAALSAADERALRARARRELHRLTGQRAESEVAVGIVLTDRPDLPELAAGEDAGCGEGLCDAARVDASQADGSLAEVLEACRCGVSDVSRRAPLAAAGTPRLTTNATRLTKARRRDASLVRAFVSFVGSYSRSRRRRPPGRSAG
jgi:hypothetical protein